jgi:hypothetical protein
MPRYFFNVYYERAELDEEGEELPDAQAAWHEATVTAGQIIQDLDGKLRPGQDWRLEVTDEFANPLYVIDVRAPIGSSRAVVPATRRPGPLDDLSAYLGLRKPGDESQRSMPAAASFATAVSMRRSRSGPGGRRAAFSRA